MSARHILHADMDAFFASIEQRDDPSLRGRPVLVGGAGRRGVVAAASYEARAFGCHSAQPMAVARRLCPHAVTRRPRGAVYQAVSRAVFGVFEAITPLVQPLSIDEAFLDVTGGDRLMGSPETVARRIKDAVREQVELTVSVGVAPNKFLAKLASDLEKPDGLTVITEANRDEILLPLPVERLPGVGPAAAKRLHALEIRTIGDLRAADAEEITARFGTYGASLMRLARGLDDRPVVPDRKAKSISHECTFPVDVEDPEHVREVLRGHGESVGRRLRRHGLRASTVTVKIRYGDFETVTRSKTLRRPTDATLELLEAAETLFRRWARRGFRPVRLIGMAAAGLSEGDGQLELIRDPERERQGRVDRVLDELQERFGSGSIGRGAGPKPRSGPGGMWGPGS